MPFDVSKFVNGLHAARDAQLRAMVIGVEAFGAMTVGVAQNLCPVGGPPVTPRDPHPGTLQASGTWTDAVLSGNTISMEIGFNTNYAAVQHENLEFRHNVGQAKYLEVAMREQAPKFGTFVASRVAAVSA